MAEVLWYHRSADLSEADLLAADGRYRRKTAAEADGQCLKPVDDEEGRTLPIIL